MKVEWLKYQKGKLEMNEKKLDEGERSLDQISVSKIQLSEDRSRYSTSWEALKELDKYAIKLIEKLTESHRILVSQNTVDLYSKTLTKCSVMCANNHQCFDTSSSVGDLSFGTSFYKVVDEQVNWTTAKVHTSINNIRDSPWCIAFDGHWLGGYNFNNDNDMEWISHPDQAMPFSDMGFDQPNGPFTQLCMVYWKS
ncbi:unnamed protein product [Mytilus edulis]|uniref:Uncharacterized protein n=1 Tax=Mytilus edulis TaxID=6550 RepID=A0A8S3URV5_MYTED|nr:unnamed protein product [Mytilus edulis]